MPRGIASPPWSVASPKEIKMKTEFKIETNTVPVTFIPAKPPRKEERTFPATKYSVANIGHLRSKIDRKVR